LDARGAPALEVEGVLLEVMSSLLAHTWRTSRGGEMMELSEPQVPIRFPIRYSCEPLSEFDGVRSFIPRLPTLGHQSHLGLVTVPTTMTARLLYLYPLLSLPSMSLSNSIVVLLSFSAGPHVFIHLISACTLWIRTSHSPSSYLLPLVPLVVCYWPF